MQKGGQKQKEGGKTVDNKEKQIKELNEKQARIFRY